MIVKRILLAVLAAVAVASSATAAHAQEASRLAATPENPCESGYMPVSSASGPLQVTSSDAPPVLNIRLMCYHPTTKRLVPIAAGQAIDLEVLGVWATSEAALNDETLRNASTSWPYDADTARGSYKNFTKSSGQYPMPEEGWNNLKNVGRPDTWGVLYWRTMVCHRHPGQEDPDGCVIHQPTDLLFIDHI
ncbi:hypothetical protein [Saccharothrix yanglingensis]|uniref:Secreted protein n=1 Tax=Saccharothrix yanglingensis TaxID=659496 RepID=A0ABU0X7E4_9PSEU|nr:hypothetical protein [Saccharothrix yanglingensis]MDQ2588060.1 hypothetical protein [Saccharothrix yanglingensis]